MVSFDLSTGTILAENYEVLGKLGDGWEGEVYKVRERGTGVIRAAKLFYPKRNKKDAALKFTAKKLHKLRQCAVLTQYSHKELTEIDDELISVLFSELVEGQMLETFIQEQRGKKLSSYEALHVLIAIAKGMSCVHARKEYHGDIHDKNIVIKRRGGNFQVRLLDVHNHGKASAKLIADDVIDMIRVFYDCIGGQKHYRSQPQWVKDICLGLKRERIRKKYKNAQGLLEYLQNFSWD